MTTKRQIVIDNLHAHYKHHSLTHNVNKNLFLCEQSSDIPPEVSDSARLHFAKQAYVCLGLCADAELRG